MWIQICHKPFNDGTERHPLLEIKIPEHFKVEVIEIERELICECDGEFDYYEIVPSSLSPESKGYWQSIVKPLGIKDSLYVEYFIKEVSR